MLFEVSEGKRSPAVLKVIGLGGGGGNAINRMLESEIRGVEFLVANTDIQALEASRCSSRLQIGAGVTGGLGSGGDPVLGRRAAEEDAEVLREHLEGADMIFIAAGMGGGTGTGASPIVGQLARDLGILTVAIVTKPFTFEGRKRMRQAEEGLAELRQVVDTLIVIPNQRLLHVVDRATPLASALRVADDVLAHATKGISEIITVPGLINVDFADVRSVMAGMGNALMGMGFGQGPDRARLAADMAIASPLLEDLSICGAQALLVNFMGGEDMTLAEVDEASNLILQAAGEEANVIFGAVVDPNIREEIRVTLIATGFGNGAQVAVADKHAARPQVAPPPPIDITRAASVAAAVQRPSEPVHEPVVARAAAVARGVLRSAVGDGHVHGGALRVHPGAVAAAAELGDGVVGPARPIGQSRPTAQVRVHAAPIAPPRRVIAPEAVPVAAQASSRRTVERPPTSPSASMGAPGAAAAVAAGAPTVSAASADIPSKVVPLVWKKGVPPVKRWSPQGKSRWQRVLSRDQMEVPSFLRRRQMD